MKTKTINVYSFDELNEDAKEKAINYYRDNYSSDDSDFISDEVTSTLDKFCDLFNITWHNMDYCEMYRSEWKLNLESDILELSGLRLQKYIWNNYKTDLFKGKYYKSWSTENKIIHRKVKSIFKSKKTGWHDESQHGKYWNVYYGLTLEHSCVLTGMCYDEDVLQPIYNFLDKPNIRTDFETLLNDCLHSLGHSVCSEIESRYEDGYIIEQIQANEYEFDEGGNML